MHEALCRACMTICWQRLSNCSCMTACEMHMHKSDLHEALTACSNTGFVELVEKYTEAQTICFGRSFSTVIRIISSVVCFNF